MIASQFSEAMDEMVLDLIKFGIMDKICFTSYPSDEFSEERFEDKIFINSSENIFKAKLQNYFIFCPYCREVTYISVLNFENNKYDSFYCRHCDSIITEED
jgi:hypothetical protein